MDLDVLVKLISFALDVGADFLQLVCLTSSSRKAVSRLVVVRSGHLRSALEQSPVTTPVSAIMSNLQ